MTPENDLEALMNAFVHSSVAAGLPPTQWSAVLISCLIGPAQQAMDTLPLQDLLDFQKVKRAVLQMLNLNPEAYQKWLCEIEFGVDYQPWFMAQRLRPVSI